MLKLYPDFSKTGLFTISLGKNKSKDLPGKSNANLSNGVGESLSNNSSRLEVSIELLYLVM
jgi:hypothetical protein